MLIPVPSSYNDILTSREGRDKVGSVTYERTFLVPNSWRSSGKIWIRFGSVCYAAKVVSHSIKISMKTSRMCIFRRKLCTG